MKNFAVIMSAVIKRVAYICANPRKQICHAVSEVISLFLRFLTKGEFAIKAME